MGRGLTTIVDLSMKVVYDEGMCLVAMTLLWLKVVGRGCAKWWRKCIWDSSGGVRCATTFMSRQMEGRCCTVTLSFELNLIW